MKMNETKQQHKHKDCKQLLGTLSEYIDGELSEELCHVLETHMEDCENCRIVVDTLRKTVNLYHTTSETEILPGDIRQRLFKSLRIEEFLD
jgi:anti-sigma factor (TIGR02949 family)